MQLHSDEMKKKKKVRFTLLNTRSLAPGDCLCTPTMRNMQTYSLARRQLVAEGHRFPRQTSPNSRAALHTTIVWIPSASHTYRMFMRAHQMCCAYIHVRGSTIQRSAIKSKGPALSQFCWNLASLDIGYISQRARPAAKYILGTPRGAFPSLV